MKPHSREESLERRAVFAERIRQARLDMGLTQQQFGEAIQIPGAPTRCAKRQVQNWEQGTRFPSLSRLIHLAEVFELDLHWLLGARNECKYPRGD